MFIWDWVGFGIDPNYILGVFTTAQIANCSDCAVLEPDLRQRSTPSSRRRSTDGSGCDIIWNMQKMLYEQSPYIVLVYARNLEAYNSAKWAGWVRSPARQRQRHLQCG